MGVINFVMSSQRQSYSVFFRQGIMAANNYASFNRPLQSMLAEFDMAEMSFFSIDIFTGICSIVFDTGEYIWYNTVEWKAFIKSKVPPIPKENLLFASYSRLMGVFQTLPFLPICDGNYSQLISTKYYGQKINFFR